MKTKTIAHSVADASELLEKIRRLVRAAPPYLAEGDALLRRCRDLQERTPRDAGSVRAAARVLAIDAAVGKALTRALLRRKRKANLQRLERLEGKIAELNSPSLLFKEGG